MARPEWLRERVREFTALRGAAVRAWSGVEEALHDDPPRFTDPRAPFRQLWGLDVALTGGSLSIATHQDDEGWGLWLRPPPARVDSSAGILRYRSGLDLPTGTIDDVTVRVEHDVVAEVLLHVGTRPLLLLAGQSYQDRDGGLCFCRLDESVLAFTDPAAADTVEWRPARK